MFSISTHGFEQKPNELETKKITFRKCDVTLDELKEYICSGHSITAIYRNCRYPMDIGQKRNINFCFTNMVMLDCDEDVNCDLQTFVDSLAITPTIAYTTFSHQQEGYGNRYRLLYIPTTPILSLDDYKYVYDYICNGCNFSPKDNCGSSVVQQCFGTHKDSLFINTGILLDVESILEGYTPELLVDKHPLKKEKENNRGMCLPNKMITDQQYIKDYYSIWNDDELFAKYDALYPRFERNMDLTAHEDTPIIKVPKDYICIRHKTVREEILDKDGDNKGYTFKVIKWKDGERRRKKLFQYGIIRRFMKEDISFEHLLHNLRHDLHDYFYNYEDTISLKQLMGIAECVMKSDLTKYEHLLLKVQKTNPKSIVNPDYCSKYDMSKKIVWNTFKNQENDDAMLKLFDRKKTDDENLKVFQENGIDICIKTLRRFRSRHNIPQYRERIKGKTE